MITKIDIIALMVIVFLLYQNKSEKYCGMCGK